MYIFKKYIVNKKKTLSSKEKEIFLANVYAECP